MVWENLEITHLIVEFAINRFSILVDELEGVGAVPVHVTVSIGGTPVTEEEGNLMASFGAKCDKVPKHVWIL